MGRETKGVDADLEIGEGQPLFIRWNIHGQVGHARFPLAALQACNLEPWKWNPFSIGAPVERHAHSTHAAHWTRARHAHASTSREIRGGPSQPRCVNCLERVQPTPVQTPLDVQRYPRHHSYRPEVEEVEGEPIPESCIREEGYRLCAAVAAVAGWVARVCCMRWTHPTVYQSVIKRI
jgi:hypothetical protein